jgi:hypothetical protein
LFFSIFLYNAFKNQWKVKPYIIYFGLCLGLKISFIPLATFFVLLYTILNKDEILMKRNLNWVKIIGLFFIISSLLIGYYFFYAEKLILESFGSNSPYILKIGFRPILYKVSKFLVGFVQNNSFQTKLIFLLSIFLGLSVFLLVAFKFLSNSFFKLALFIIIGVVVCSPCIILIPFDFKYLFYFIFDNRPDHGMDNPLINYISWAKYFLKGLTDAPIGLFVLIFSLPFLVIFFKLFKKQSKGYLFKVFLLVVFILLTMGLVFLNVKRLWGHYLHVGYIFIIILYFLAIENKSKNIFTGLLVLPLLFFTCYLFKFSMGELKIYAQRSRTVQFEKSKQSYLNTITFLNGADKEKNVIYWDAQLYFPDYLNPNFTKVIFYDNFNNRASSDDFFNKLSRPDFLVLNKNNNSLRSLIIGCTSNTFSLTNAVESQSNDQIKKDIVVDGLHYILANNSIDQYLIYTKYKF